MRRSRVFLLYFPKGAQSPQDHITIDEYVTMDVNSCHQEVERVLQYSLPTMRAEDFVIYFQGKPRLYKASDMLREPSFRSAAQTIETFRQRAEEQFNNNNSQFYYSQQAETFGAVTGEFSSSMVALISCEGVRKLRFALENNKYFEAIRGTFMPRGAFVGHMTIGKRPRDAWATSMGRLQANMTHPGGLGSRGGRLVLSVSSADGSNYDIRLWDFGG